MAYAAAALAIVGAVTAMYGAYRQSETAQAQAKASEQASRQEAAMATAQSQAAMSAERLETRRRLATYGPAGARAGIDVASKSLLEIELEAARLGEYSAQLKGYGGRMQAVRAGYQADLYRWNRKTLQRSQWLDVGLAGVSGAVGAYSMAPSSSIATSTTPSRVATGSLLSP